MGITVALSCDDYYTPFAAVCMASILNNTKEYIEFYVLCDGVSEANKAGIKLTCETLHENGHVVFIDIDSVSVFSSLAENEVLTKAMYGRYLISDLIPEIDRVIYTDCDAVFVSDIKELWEENNEGYAIAAVPSQRGLLNNNYETYKLTHELNPDHCVFMSGLLIIECAEWRKRKIGQALINISKENKLFDQEAMNVYFDNNDYYKLDPKYCVIYKIMDTCYASSEARRLKEDQSIVHYPGGGGSKPWYNPNLISAGYFWRSVKSTSFDYYIQNKYGILDETELVRKIKDYNKIIIYGAGHVGRVVLGRLSTRKYDLQNICFAVSDLSCNSKSVLNVDVYEIDELAKYKKTAVVIIAVDVKDVCQIDKSLIEKGFCNIVVINDTLRKDLESNSSYLNDTVNMLCGRIVSLENDVNTLYELLNYAVDIRTILPAKNELRNLQLADIEMLKIFHSLCEKYDLTYWLIAGTLLGAVRHHDFIPWDDDLDIAMPREDYEVIASILSNELSSFGFKVNEGVGFVAQVYRLIYKNTSVQLDIWPYDSTSNVLDKDSLYEKSLLCNDVLWSKYSLKDVQNGKVKFPREDFKRIKTKIIGDNVAARDSTFCFMGSECRPDNRTYVHETKTIFPLKMGVMNDAEFYIPCDAEAYLREMYGDYNTFPKIKVMGHQNIRQDMQISYKEILKEMKDIYRYYVKSDDVSI